MNALKVAEKDQFSFEETYQTFQVFKTIDPYYYRQMREVFYRVRRFAREKAEPMALYIDRELRRDPENKEPIWEFARLCGQEGMFSLLLPKNFGGGGFPLMASTMIFEELCAVCSGEANVLGGHLCGYAPFYVTMKLRLFEKICRDIVEKEKSDKPPMMALAWTEPLVGSDNLQKELIPGARIGCEAKAVDGGWVLNGTKCFISSGSISAYHVAIMPVDRKRPLETITGFLVPTETKGFSFGRDEHKMGMKATPASMMIYEDCYLPDEYRLTPVGGMANIYNVIGFGLVVVGAMAAGVARGAYERAVTFAREHKVREKLLINHEWAQIILAEMLMNVLAARAVYMDAAFCSLNCGFGQLVPPRRGGFRFKLLAEILLGTELMKKVADNEERFYRMMGWAIDRFLDTPQEHGFGALAKVKCSDYAVTNSNLGIDLMGKAGLRHDYGMEKIYRDAKLLQIYEATNELNRMVLFNRLIRQEEPGIEMFGGGCNG